MNESAEYTRLLAQAYSKLADDYSAMTQRVIAAEARVKELEADNTRGAAYVQHLKEKLIARKQGGAK